MSLPDAEHLVGIGLMRPLAGRQLNPLSQRFVDIAMELTSPTHRLESEPPAHSG
ncbi:hypothetical protein GGE16_002362 [Rhizobium leguminosarum]|uniref:Uncharacterized protein n=1 Tax=Rhizobium leguminosarum TaxID=384 RepID=A0AAE2SW66_RHILE|nr:hypothetical protein [Rhizobium leguminosarum]MBB4431426.1 hypothetical protein [Rhizobium esperanzae]MBB4296966.1 hypothetical protein [Rhizobium leguminosarum]MBB4307773.1 hypothetical protein [Rhizobium leguminosarum]MBB4415608.1 hypothetical protein [Rhizobium leguminosarum]